MNIQAMMKQAQAMQKDMMKIKDEVDNTEFTAESSLVKVTVKGTKEVIKVEIWVRIRWYWDVARYDNDCN